MSESPHIQSLLALKTEYERVHNEINRAPELKSRLQSESRNIIESGAWDNEKEMQRAAVLANQLASLPFRVESLHRDLEAINRKENSISDAAIADIEARLTALFEGWQVRCLASVPELVKDVEARKHIATSIFAATERGQELQSLASERQNVGQNPGIARVQAVIPLLRRLASAEQRLR